jgi:hypothetical protein
MGSSSLDAGLLPYSSSESMDVASVAGVSMVGGCSTGFAGAFALRANFFLRGCCGVSGCGVESVCSSARALRFRVRGGVVVVRCPPADDAEGRI